MQIEVELNAVESDELLEAVAEELQKEEPEGFAEALLKMLTDKSGKTIDIIWGPDLEFVKEDDGGLGNYEDILIYNRNRNWVQKLKTLMPEKSLTIAVGAGHLAGEKGLIKLLRKEGYSVKPVKYKMKMERVI